jgi:hypothetical protein
MFCYEISAMVYLATTEKVILTDSPAPEKGIDEFVYNEDHKYPCGPASYIGGRT